MPPYLSKSRYLQAVQCRKLLWLAVHEPDLAGPVDQKTQHIFDMGHRVGELAQTLFKNGVLIKEDHLHTPQAAASTQKAVAAGAPALFEAGVICDTRLMCRIDILSRVAGKKNAWDLYEVKMTTSTKDVHIPDAAFQRYCFEKAGFNIRKVFLMHLDSSYVRHGDIDPEKLFTSDEITDDTTAMLAEVKKNAPIFVADIDSNKCPEIEIGPQCEAPYECPYYDYCHGETEPYTISELLKGQQVIPKLEAMGIKYLKDIPDDFPLNNRHRQQVISVKTGKPSTNPSGIQAFLDSLEYPLYHFDYETIGSALPLFDNSRPYQNIPFQFSLHIQKKPCGPYEHHEFLPEDKTDPREHVIRQMLDLIGKKGSILAYNASFETGKIKEMARDFPKYSDKLLSLIPRFRDLIVPFRSGDYAHYEFHGSASLKSVLPVLVPELSYENLAIQEGGAASLLAELWYMGKMEDEEWEKTRKNLLKYCGMDTLAMVEILKVLYKTCKLQ